MKRLIIKQDKRTVRQNLGEVPVVLGRDPDCDLFFADKKLSRRHARFEPTSTGLRFVDLGSRNGSWVNFKKVEEAQLKPGDTVRVGGLFITYEEDAPPTVSADTASLPAVPSPSPPSSPPAAADASSTVVLQRPPAAKSSDSAEDATHLKVNPPPQSRPVPTPLPPKSQSQETAGDQTLMLPQKPPPPAAPPSAGDGTLIFKPEASTPPKGGVGAQTRMLPVEDLRPKTAPLPTSEPPAPEASFDEPEPVLVPSDAGLAERIASWPWSTKFLALITTLGLSIYIVLAWPLVRTMGNSLREESLRRGRVLLELLATSNAAVVGEGRVRDLDLEIVTRKERVKEALILDLEGQVLAPSARADETLEAIEGITVPIDEVRTFYLGRRGDGDFVMVQPLLHQGERVAVAVLVYTVATASGSWAMAVLFLGLLVFLVGVVTASFIGKKITLEPVAVLRDDVEAVVKGDARFIPGKQGFAELSDLAHSINRLIDRAEGMLAPAEPEPVSGSNAEPLVGVSASILQTAPPPDARPQAPPAVVAPNLNTPPPDKLSPSPHVSAARTPAGGEGARFWADESFIVSRAEEAAETLVGCAHGEMSGKHIIEAVKDQKLLEVILDSINALPVGGEPASGAAQQAQLVSGIVEVSAAKDGSSVVVSLRRV